MITLITGLYSQPIGKIIKTKFNQVWSTSLGVWLSCILVACNLSYSLLSISFKYIDNKALEDKGPILFLSLSFAIAYFCFSWLRIQLGGDYPIAYQSVNRIWWRIRSVLLAIGLLIWLIIHSGLSLLIMNSLD